MAELKVEVWVIPSKKQVLVTDFPGPPAEEARQAANERGYATVSELGFPSECYLGPFDTWADAMAAATTKAEELGYTLEIVDTMFPNPDDDSEGWGWDEEYYDEEELWETMEA